MSKTTKATAQTLAALVIAPHPDDAEINCGGLLALLAEKGYRVGIADLTRGELGSQGTPEERATEAAGASLALGLAHRENLGLPDGGIDPHGTVTLPDGKIATQREVVADAIRRLRPEIVIAPYAEDRHPDHRHASVLVRDALFFAGATRFETRLRHSPHADASREPSRQPFQPKQVLYYPFRTELRPSFVVDITAVGEKKQRAIDAYRSQLERRAAADERPDVPVTLISSPLTRSALAARDRYFGAMIGVEAGEAYLAYNALRLSDPVAFFRAEPVSGAMFFPGW